MFVIKLLCIILIAKTNVFAWKCDDGWEKFGNKCYLASNVRRSFDESVKYCQQINADAASIHSEEENEFLSGLTDEHKHYWTGGRRIIGTKNKFAWSDKSEFNYTNWEQGDPNNLHGNEHCIIMVRDNGLWWDFPCDRMHYTFCQRTEKQQFMSKYFKKVSNERKENEKEMTCHDGWHKFGNKCYWKNDLPKTYDENVESCRQMFAEPVSIHSKEENAFIKSITTNAEQYWLGGRRVVPNKHIFAWNDSSEFNYTNWHKHDPNNLNNKEHCILLVMDGLWFDVNCEHKRYQLCQRTEKQEMLVNLGVIALLSVVRLDVVPTIKCDKGWHSYGNKCYYKSDVKTKQSKASEICSQMNGHLVSITSDNENEFVKSILGTLETQRNYRYWLGAKRVNDDFQWSDGSPFIYTHWHRHDPNNLNNEEDCVSMVRGIGREGVWIDMNCNRTANPICQRNVRQQLFAQLLQDLQRQGLISDYLLIAFYKQVDKIDEYSAMFYDSLANMDSFVNNNTNSIAQLNQTMIAVETNITHIQQEQSNLEESAIYLIEQMKTIRENELNLTRKMDAMEYSSKLIVDALKGINEEKNKSVINWKNVVTKDNEIGIHHEKCLNLPKFSKCYYFIKTQMNIIAANELCNSMNATLLTIQNENEQSFIKNNLLHDDFYWTAGVPLLDSVPMFVWMDGSKVFPEYFREVNNMEKKGEKEYGTKCLAIRNGQLVKKSCFKDLSVICQRSNSTIKGTSLIDMHSRNLIQLKHTINDIKSNMNALKERDLKIIDALNKMYISVSIGNKQVDDEEEATTASDETHEDGDDNAHSVSVGVMNATDLNNNDDKANKIRRKRSISMQNDYTASLKQLQNDNLKLHASVYYLKLTAIAFCAFFVVFAFSVTKILRNAAKRSF